MSKSIDITNQRFGRLISICSSKRDNGRTYWLCQCDCGKQTSVYISKLTTGETKSCGCLRNELTSKRQKKHGLTKTTLHNAWLNMKNRCENPKFNEFHRYGGRGITYCEEWKSFNKFMEWALKNGFSDKKSENGRNILSLDRIDLDGNYEPSNCKWSTVLEQAKNKCNTVLYKYNGVDYTLTELMEFAKVSDRYTISRRVKNGWTVEKAVNTPSMTYKGVKNG